MLTLRLWAEFWRRVAAGWEEEAEKRSGEGLKGCGRHCGDGL